MIELSRILPHLIYQFKSEHELIKAIDELSLKFTQAREHIHHYLKDPKLVSAYTAFYLTTNIPKLEAVFDWLPSEFLNELKKCHVIDLGAGPGTFSVAFEEWGKSQFQGSIIQIETSELMREQAKKLWQGLYPERSIIQQSKYQEVTVGPKVLLFGHSANEMGADQVLFYIEAIKPNHVIFIEPGTKSFFPAMLEIRESLVKDQFHIVFPCPNSSKCPMAGDAENWCHQFIHVAANPEIDRISQMVKKDRRHLPLTVHVYSRTFLTQAVGERVVRILPETKFSLEWEVCQNNHIEHFQIMKRDLSKAQLKELSSLLAGQLIESELLKELEKSKRVKLLKINNKTFRS